MRKLYLTFLAAVMALCASAAEHKMYSPDGKYEMTVTDVNGAVEYSISWGGRQIVLPSRLGIKSGQPYLEGLKIKSFKANGETDQTWDPVYGERDLIRDHYNSYVLEFSRESDNPRRANVPVALEVRAYDEGVAFRYNFTGGSYLKITDEYTEFSLPEGSQAYFTQRAQTVHQLLPLKDWPGDGQSDRPLLVQLPDYGYVCLAEAQVVDYVRTKFSLGPKPNTIYTAMYGPVEDIAPYHTPWRLVMYGEKAGTILQNNDIFYNLNPECKIENTSWIRPGKVMREVTLTTEGGKALVDFALKRNLQYIHFDSGWYGIDVDKSSDATTVSIDPRRNQAPDALDLEEVIRYAKERGIGVFLYVDQRALQQQLDEILPVYQKWGVAGIKFGFVHVGSQIWTKWMHEAVAKCAKYGLMVDVHDEYRPTGFSRTYPNLMTQEGVRGNEEFPDAFNNTVLPFTRFVCGPADYTICYYRQDFSRLNVDGDSYGPARRKSIQTTPAHQLALSVVYYSPLQYMYWYDKPSDSRDEPELKFFDDVYTVWDDTKILDGVPGEHITVARRHGDEWFVGSITNASRKVSISLDFLPEGVHTAEIYTDGDKSVPTRTKVRVEKSKVKSKDVLEFNLRESGGVAIRIYAGRR